MVMRRLVRFSTTGTMRNVSVVENRTKRPCEGRFLINESKRLFDDIKDHTHVFGSNRWEMTVCQSYSFCKILLG